MGKDSINQKYRFIGLDINNETRAVRVVDAIENESITTFIASDTQWDDIQYNKNVGRDIRPAPSPEFEKQILNNVLKDQQSNSTKEL